MGLIQETRRFAQHKQEALFSIPDESTAPLDEDDDEGEDIIKSINSLLDQGKLGDPEADALFNHTRPNK